MGKARIVIFVIVSFLILLNFVSAVPSTFILPQEALGNKTVTLEIGKIFTWNSGQGTSILNAHSIQNGTVMFTLEISELSYRFLLNSGESFGIDLNRDSVADGSLTLVKIENSRVEVRLSSKYIQGAVDSPKEPLISSSEKGKNMAFNVGIGVLVLIILLVLAYALWAWRRRDPHSGGGGQDLRRHPRAHPSN